MTQTTTPAGAHQAPGTSPEEGPMFDTTPPAPVASLAEAREIAARVFASTDFAVGVHVLMTFGEVVVDRDGVVKLAEDVA
jgi:hypothetical protein